MTATGEPPTLNQKEKQQFEFQVPKQVKRCDKPSQADSPLASQRARVNSITDNCWDLTLDSGPTWSSQSESGSHNGVPLTGHPNLLADWLLLPDNRHYSPGSSLGNSFIESTPDEYGLLDPIFVSSGFALNGGSDTEFSSPSEQFLASQGEAWDAGTALGFEYPLFPPFPVADNDKVQARPRSGEHLHNSKRHGRSSAPITFTGSSDADAHLVFFSHDLGFAPLAAVYNVQNEEDTVGLETSPEIEALLEDMSSGPANISASPLLPPAPPPTTAPPSSSTTPAIKSLSPPKPTPATPARVSKEFHFVSNSDKAGAARVRNTIASRKHRQSKVNRIAELEKLLAEAEEERDMWKQRALGTN